MSGGAGADERPRFVGIPGPSNEEVAELLAELAKRVTKMLHAHGRLLDDGSDEEAEPQLVFAARPSPPSCSLFVLRTSWAQLAIPPRRPA